MEVRVRLPCRALPIAMHERGVAHDTLNRNTVRSPGVGAGRAIVQRAPSQRSISARR